MATQPLYVLLCSQERDKLQMGSMLASVAAVSERPVHVFVSMGAIKAFDKTIEGAARYSEGPFTAELTDKNAPDPVDLFGQGKMLGDEMTIHACSMVLDVLGWEEDRLVDDLFDGQMGLTKFLSDAETGQLITL